MFKRVVATTKESAMMYRTGAAAGLKLAHIQALEGALRHPEGLVSPPPDIPIHAHGKFLRELAAMGHVEIVRSAAFREEDVWYAEDGARLLRITDSGVDAVRDALSLFRPDDSQPMDEARPLSDAEETSFEPESMSDPASEMSEARTDLAQDVDLVAEEDAAVAHAQAEASPQGEEITALPPEPGQPMGEDVASPGTAKRSGACAKVMEMLNRRNGASIQELALVTGWRTHTVRGFLSQLRKKGIRIETSTSRGDAGGRAVKFYRFASIQSFTTF